jgi:hypothetical protein
VSDARCFGLREASRATLLLVVDLPDRQPGLLGNHSDQHVPGRSRQAQGVQALPDFDAFLRIPDRRGLCFQLTVPQCCALLRFPLHDVASLSDTAGNGGQNVIG